MRSGENKIYDNLTVEYIAFGAEIFVKGLINSSTTFLKVQLFFVTIKN